MQKPLLAVVLLFILPVLTRAQTPPPPAAAGAPLEQQPPPPLPGATTDNAPRGPQLDPAVPGTIHEGTHITRRTGRLSRSPDGQQMIFSFDPDEHGFPYPPMVLLPNLKLMLLEGAVTTRNNDFAVSGTVTEYRGHNYLMLDNVPHGTIPDRPVVTVVREGTPITNRTGRLSHNASGQPVFTFDADGKTVQDPPMIILADQKLQLMELSILGQGKDVHFRVSGSVTEYKGKNYILLDKAVLIPDVDQQM